MPRRICQICGREQPLERFYRDNSKPLHHELVCRTCSNQKRQRRRKRAHVREILAIGAAWKEGQPGKRH